MLTASAEQPQTLDLMQFRSAGPEQRCRKAIEAVRSLFSQGKTACVSFSAGKDSSAVMHLTVEAAREAKANGENPRVVVLSSDTGVENPELALLLRKEHAKLKRALARENIPHDVIMTHPSLASSWAVRVLGGNKLPSFPGASHECAIDFKVEPMRKARNALFRRAGKDAVVTLLGTRYDESVARAHAMAARQEVGHRPYRNSNGELVMSPLAFWTSDDVWELLGLARSGAVTSYSDFADTFRLYADAGGTSCAVVSDAITEGVKAARGGCGARFGCYTCVAISGDRSLSTMVESDPRYAYMAGLGRLRDHIASARYDFTKRYWVHRGIGERGVKLEPDCFSPGFLLELFRYAATLDYEERQAARRAGHRPRFQLLTAEAVVVIDALWSLNGFHPPHTALLEWRSISDGKTRFPVPVLRTSGSIAQRRMPKAVWLPTDATWDGPRHELAGGFLDAETMLANPCVSVETRADGRTIPARHTERRMEVDIESLEMALDFEWDAIMERHRVAAGDWTSGYRFWTEYGTLSLTSAQAGEHDKILRRTAWRARNGFLGEAGNRKAQTMAREAQYHKRS